MINCFILKIFVDYQRECVKAFIIYSDEIIDAIKHYSHALLNIFYYLI